MFSLNSIPPQLVLPLAQLGSACSVLRALATQHLPSTQQRVNQAIVVTAATERPITLNDVTETIETNLQELGLDELARDIRVETLAPILDMKHVESLLPGHRGSTAYLSSDSFFKNKNGFSESELWDATFGGRLTQHQFRVTLQHLGGGVAGGNWLSRTFSQQIRGFKTKRSSSSGGIGIHSIDNSYTSLGNIKDALLGRVSTSKKSTGRQSDRLKTMLADYNDSPDTQEKLKVAFAEGYTAHDKKEVDGASLWVRRLVRLAWYGLFVWLLLQIVQSYGAMGGTADRDDKSPRNSAVRNNSSLIPPSTFPPTASSIIPDMKLNVLKGDRYEVNPEDIHVCFSDIKGVDEAKQELQDVVEFLRDPGKFKALGAKLPKGVLLVGPPGIGKTLLARAVAGEAAVPFFHASGSEFDEIFVGTGAKRVRQLFDAAKMRAPCVIFIDEIDTVGAKRTSSQIHPYANQTINQLLSEMDGFMQNDGVIVLGATNRRDNLDKALLRPGRFDVEVRVYPPDLKGRAEIIEHYLSKVKVGTGVDVYKLAKGTTGCTGADLENLVNQAALKAAMDEATAVSMVHLEYAQDKILMGPAKKSKIPDEETNMCTAYHEAGHTLVAYFTKDATPLHKVTIVPRGTSLGHTSFIPDKEEYNLTRSQLLARMDVAMGGRVGEEMVFGSDKVTTGASSDFHQATAIATAMVKKFGMSEKVGVRVFDDEEVESGLSFLKVNDLSPQMAELVDSEIKRLLQESYERAKTVIKAHQKEHKALATSLLTNETLSREEILAILNGKVPPRHI